MRRRGGGGDVWRIVGVQNLTFLPGAVPDNAESPLANSFSLVHFDIKLKVKIRHRWEKVDRRSLTFLGSSALKQ